MLYVPAGGGSFGTVTTSWGTTRPGSTSQGTSVTPGTSGYGSYAQVGNDLTADCYGLIIVINNNSAASASRTSVTKIAIDPAGGTSFTDIATGYLSGGAGIYPQGAHYYYLPIFIPSGAAVAAAGYSSVATAYHVGMYFLHQPSRPECIRMGSYQEAIGVSGTGGTTITPGQASEGSWTSIGTTSKDLWMWDYNLQIPTTDTAWQNGAIHCDIAYGDGSTKVLLVNDYLSTTSTSEWLGKWGPLIALERHVPGGSTIYARAQHSGATLDSYQIAVYGVGG